MCVSAYVCVDAYRGISSVPLNFRSKDPRCYYTRALFDTYTHIYARIMCGR